MDGEKSSSQDLFLEQLSEKVKSLEVMLQNINKNTDKLWPEEEDDMESYLHWIAAEYVQTRAEEITKKRLGF